MSEHLADPAQIRERLIRLRQAQDIASQREMADRLGINEDAYRKAESGALGKEIAFLICAKFPGVTLDWLYFGRDDLLPVWLQRAISQHPKPDARLPRGRPPKRR